MKHLFTVALLLFGLSGFAQDDQGSLGDAPAFPRGAIPTAAHKIEAAKAFTPLSQAAERFAVIPTHLQYWGNNQYGICVTAEECFAKLAYAKMCGDDEVRVSDSDCIQWARRHGVLNGADLLDVMQMVQRDGLPANGKLYTDGEPHKVNWSDEAELQSAISLGPVKLGIQAGDLPKGAGTKNGWWSIRNVPGGREDHAVALCGYGPAGYLFGEMGLPVPEGLAVDKPGYLLFTWSTIGFVSHDWLMGAVGEAWVRMPTTVGQTPAPILTPYKLFDSKGQLVGSADGYADLALARLQAQDIADKQKISVTITDATGKVVETLTPTPAPPPQPTPWWMMIIHWLVSGGLSGGAVHLLHRYKRLA